MNIKVLIFLETWVQTYLFFSGKDGSLRCSAYFPHLLPPFLALVLLLLPPSSLLQVLGRFLSGLADPLFLVWSLSVCGGVSWNLVLLWMGEVSAEAPRVCAFTMLVTGELEYSNLGSNPSPTLVILSKPFVILELIFSFT